MKPLSERLKAEEQDEDLIKLRDKCVNLVKMSRGKMSKCYPKWDMHNDVYMGVRPMDKHDAAAQDHGEPVKMVVPMSFAQIQTFVAFSFLLFTQNRRFYEFIPTGSEDYDLTNDCEEILERDLRRNQWNQKLYQLLLDIARFGIGVTKCSWVTEYQYAPTIKPESVRNVEGFNFSEPEESSVQEFVKYQGNRVANISPYNFFPDTRFPMSEWRKGAFCADETEWHISQLKEWQRKGLMYGVENIEPMTKKGLKDRGDTRLDSFVRNIERNEKKKGDQIVCLTTMQMKLNPKEAKVGEEDYELDYLVQIANDDRIVDVRPSGYLHDEFVYDVGLFSPDMQQQIGASLSDTISSMQDVVSFLINSRLTSVRKSLENNLIIDPSSVDMSTVESRSPFILTKKGSARMGVDKFVRQLSYVDTTARHLDDADVIMKVMQMVTGVNENAMGQFHGGRRSATEARAANGGAAARMKLVDTVVWDDCLASLGRKMMFNSRQGLEVESFVKILGESARERHMQYQPPNPSDLVGMEDHFVFDSTLQSEKGFMAQSLQELVGAILSNPMVMQVLPLDVGKLMEEVLQLRGVDNIERFRIQPPVQQGEITGDEFRTGAPQPAVGTQGNTGV